MASPILNQIKRSARLPSPPGMALQILDLCQQPDVSIGDLANTLAADPALSLRLLKYANSALVGAQNEVTSVRDAVLMLGLRSVRLMALSFSLVANDDPRACRGFDYERFWAHSVACAVSARYLANRSTEIAPEEAFAAGLLSHIGKLVFAVGMPKEYQQVLQVSGGTLGRTERTEAAALGCSHHDLGADLLIDWDIPRRLAEVVRYQHHPEQIADDPPVQQLAVMVGIATSIADILCQAGSEQLLDTRKQALASCPFLQGEQQVNEALRTIQGEFSELAQILSVQAGATPNPDEIQAEAGAVLSELSLAAQLQNEAITKENRGLQEKAWTDALTGIPNRAAFDRHYQEAWKEVSRKRCPITLIMADIDHFKQFNDQFGHQTGDAVLKAVARCLPGAVRSVDMVARYGGEEFVAVLPNADRITAAQIAVKMRKAVESCVVEFEGQQHRVTISIGAALLPIVTPLYRAQSLIEAADKQLYASKNKGRNCCSMKQLAPDNQSQAAHASPA